jgi:hypothetical protein
MHALTLPQLLSKPFTNEVFTPYFGLPALQILTQLKHCGTS